MRTDTYTKVVLTVIAVCLFMIGCKQYASPSTKAEAAGQVLPLQVSKGGSGLFIFNPNTGLIYEYDYKGDVAVEWSVSPVGGSFNGKVDKLK